MRMRVRSAAFLCLNLLSVSAFASAVDDVAVIRQCGAPISQDRQRSQATNEFTEDFFYPDDVVIHFLPVDGGWQLSSAWMRHIPVTREGLADRMPCVKEALAEAEVAPRPQIDPTIAAQTIQNESRRGFGIPFLWLIFALILTLLVFILIPTPRKRTPDLPLPRAPQRLPDVVVQERIRQSSASHAAVVSARESQASAERAKLLYAEEAINRQAEAERLAREERERFAAQTVNGWRPSETDLPRDAWPTYENAGPREPLPPDHGFEPEDKTRRSSVVTWGPPR